MCSQEVKKFTVKPGTRVAKLAQDISDELYVRRGMFACCSCALSWFSTGSTVAARSRSLAILVYVRLFVSAFCYADLLRIEGRDASDNIPRHPRAIFPTRPATDFSTRALARSPIVPNRGLKHPMQTIRAWGPQFDEAKGKNVYMEHPPVLRKATEKNLQRTLEELDIRSGNMLTLTCPDLVTTLRAVVVITDE